MISIRRLLAATAAAVAAVAVPPAPAQAAPAPFTFSVHDLGVTPAGKLTIMDLRAGPGAPARLTDVKVVIDATAVADFATAWVPSFPGGEEGEEDPVPAPECAVAGAVTTCSWAVRTDDAGWLPRLVVAAKEGAAVGRSGKLPITFSAAGVDPLTTTPTISVAEDVDLAAGPAGPKVTLEPGKLVELPIEIRNTATKPVDGVVAAFVGEADGLRLAGRYTNCVYRSMGDEAWCRFDQELAAGTTYRVGAPVVQLRPDADRAGADPHFAYLHLWWTADDIDEVGGEMFKDPQMVPGTEGVLRLEPVPAADVSALTTDSNGLNNMAWGFVTAKAVTAPPPPRPTASPSPSPSARSSSPAARATRPPAAGGQGGGGLAITGPDAPLTAGVGVALLLAGIGALLLGRRRPDAR